MFGIASRYVAAKRKAPAFHIVCNCNFLKKKTPCAVIFIAFECGSLETSPNNRLYIFVAGSTELNGFLGGVLPVCFSYGVS